MPEKIYDVIIIGAGPAGMTAALYASRSNLKVLMLDRGIYGGQMNNTAAIENYPGFKSIMGPELGEQMYQSATQFGVDYQYGTVETVALDGHDKIVKTTDEEFRAPALVIATGSEYKKIGIPGEDEYSGKGVSYCAVCDGAFFKNEDVVVIGGGDSAVEEGIYLTQLAKSVTIIHRRDQLRAQQILQKRAFANDKIKFIWNAAVEEIQGDDKKVTAVRYRDKESGQEKIIKTAGVFIYVGIKPNTEGLDNLNILDENRWITTNELTETSVPGIFAVGDVRKKDLRQITTAVGEGGLAGQGVFNYLQTLNDVD
ncbi:thioredoxin-disulfide reductase [Bombilactobacillus bombi]|uniref:thioredoxin-disulfide reductase n=1 Tax=Bombilactobacillus bombi TaxID=1303590 RepID=UPI0015E609A3|nr:thioredoxin-disulfide reductase [Bombilactobacillus bombi]MBA1434420.1 thioredoxin-disulfide reductase [Bombilactobacillus bombi]